MPKSSRITESRELLEKKIGTSLPWNGYADGRKLVAKGEFGLEDPIILARFGRDSRSRYMCAGTEGVFRDLGDFYDDDLCEHCPYRTGTFVKWTSSSPWKNQFRAYALDLVSTSENDGSYCPAAYVPSGCPHAKRELIEIDQREIPFGREYARIVPMSDWREEAFPYSWKVYVDGSKVTLALQYRKLFVNTDANKMKSEFYYQAFTCDIASGQTYVSNIHNGSRVMRRGVASASIDNITYTRESQLVADAHLSDSPALTAAFSAFRSTVSKELEKIGYVHESSASRKNDPSCESEATESFITILEDIAVMNRFPKTRLFPLPLIYNDLSDNARYMVADIPRNADVIEMAEVLGIKLNDDLEDVLRQSPELLEAVFLFNLIGCEDPADIVGLCRKEDFYLASAAVYEIVRRIPNGRVDPASFASVVAACSMGPGGWAAWFDNLKGQYGVFSSNATEGLRLGLESALLRALPLPNATSVSALTMKLESMAVFSPSAQIDAVIETNKLRTENMCWKKRRFSSDWEIRVPANEKEWNIEAVGLNRRGDAGFVAHGTTKLFDIYENGTFTASISVRAYCHLDKRKWNAPRRREFLELRQKPSLNEHDKKRVEELEDILQESLVMDWRMESLHAAEYGMLTFHGVDPHLISIVREWCSTFKIKINKATLDTFNKAVRKWKKKQGK